MTVAIALALLVLAPQAQQQQSDMEFLGERARTSALLEIEGEGEGRIRLRFPWDETAPQRLSLPAATSPRGAAETRLPVILRHRERAASATATCGPAATREAATHNKCLDSLRPALAPDAAAARDYLDARCALGAGLGAVRLSVGDTVILDLPRARLACDDEGFTLLGPAGSASRLRIER
ncbi:hypothetical protein [Sphingomicrobium astaxanthinifaciens]|uniref:hypothetical protein n=1 Tax=Sphingomicrobium astaxanthinifaciens TaxID=1227949 RepID=UPI001FCA6E0E|nr:hypothetical protein [Sphingomicrobium astaxanthinifaciens]MCJ7420870.1 hypothetical protein [Sphingomicrobium astaxanthinifaciens]